MQAADGNERYRTVFDSHFEAVRAYCLRRLPVADANDAVAEVFVVAWRRIDDMPSIDEVRPWLFGIARNVLRHSYRSSARRSRLQRRLDGLGHDVAPSPEVAVVRRMEDEALLAALESLSDGDREVLMLRTWEELTAPEIAATLGISVSAAEKRVSRAYARLARAVGRTSAAPTDSPSNERGGG